MTSHALSRHDRHPPDMGLLVCVFALCTIGIIMVYSASQYEGLRQFASTQYLAGKQIKWFFLSMAAFVAASVIDGRVVKKYPYALAGAALVLLLLVQVFSEKTLGANSRFRMGGMSLQPSEFAKVFMVLFWSAALASLKEWKDLFKSPKDFAPAAVMGLCILLVFKEPDMGGASVLVFMALSLLYIKGLPVRFLMGAGSLLGVAFWAAVITRPYRMARILAFLNPEADPLGKGYNALQSMMSFASGGLMGAGLGNGKQKFDYLPEQHADFIYSVIGEEWGLLGAGLVAFLFLMILWRGMAIARRQQDEFSHLLATGIVALLVGQGLLNMLVAVSAVPATGLTLPFVSYGGSSLMASAIMAGMLVKLSSCRVTGVMQSQEPMDDVIPLVRDTAPDAIRARPRPTRPEPVQGTTPRLAPSTEAPVRKPRPTPAAATVARSRREVSRVAQTGAGGRGNRRSSLPRY